MLGFAAVTAHVLDVGGSYPGHQRRRVRHVRGGQDLQRPQVVRGRRPQRGPRPHGLRQRAHRDHEPRRHGGHARRLQPRRRAVQAPAGEVRAGRRHVRRLRLDGLLREAAARRDPQAARRRVRGADGVARRRRPQPRRAPARGDEGHRRGRPHHDRPDGLQRRGADGLQRPLRGLAPGRRLLRDPHPPARPGGGPEPVPQNDGIFRRSRSSRRRARSSTRTSRAPASRASARCSGSSTTPSWP